MTSEFATVGDYIKSFETDNQYIISSIIAMLKDEFPTLNENMNLKMPTYEFKGHAVFSIQVQPNYTAFYVYPHHLLSPFDAEIKKYRTGKTCLKIKKLTESAEDVIIRITRHLKAEL